MAPWLLLKISGLEVTPSITSAESCEQFWRNIRQIWRICEPWQIQVSAWVLHEYPLGINYYTVLFDQPFSRSPSETSFGHSTSTDQKLLQSVLPTFHNIRLNLLSTHFSTIQLLVQTLGTFLSEIEVTVFTRFSFLKHHTGHPIWIYISPGNPACG